VVGATATRSARIARLTWAVHTTDNGTIWSGHADLTEHAAGVNRSRDGVFWLGSGKFAMAEDCPAEAPRREHRFCATSVIPMCPRGRAEPRDHLTEVYAALLPAGATTSMSAASSRARQGLVTKTCSTWLSAARSSSGRCAGRYVTTRNQRPRRGPCQWCLCRTRPCDGGAGRRLGSGLRGGG
jgi:hypothetical protein